MSRVLLLSLSMLAGASAMHVTESNYGTSNFALVPRARALALSPSSRPPLHGTRWHADEVTAGKAVFVKFVSFRRKNKARPSALTALLFAYRLSSYLLR